MFGILGGTFDPPHNAHLLMAVSALRQLDLDSVRLMPAGDPWQKRDTLVTSARHRWEMTRRCAEGAPGVVADDTEIHRPGPSHTIDTIERLDARCVLILGADAAQRIRSWHRGDELVELVDIVVAPRASINRNDVEAEVGGSLIWLEMSEQSTSSTVIRSLVAADEPWRHLVPMDVAEYIEEHGLYCSRGPRHTSGLSSNR